MSLKLHCPSCHRSLRLPAPQAGETVRCPNCGAPLTPPAPAPEAEQQTSVQSAATPPTPPPLRRKAAPAGQGEPTASPSDAPPPPDAPPTPAAPPPMPPPAMMPPPAPFPADSPLPGIEHTWLKRWPAYKIGLWMIAAAAIGLIPVLLDLAEHVRHTGSASLSRWALGLLLASGLQVFYAVYLLQLPDWGTLRVVSIVMLVFAATYAALLAALAFARPYSGFVVFLELGDTPTSKQAATWCLVMLGVFGLLSYSSGRTSIRWQRTYWHWGAPRSDGPF